MRPRSSGAAGATVLVTILLLVPGSFEVSAKTCGKLKRLEFRSAVADFHAADGQVFKKQTLNRANLGDWSWDVLGSSAMVRNRYEGKTCPAVLDMGSTSEESWGLEAVQRVLVLLTSADEQEVQYFDLPSCAKIWGRKSTGFTVEDRRLKIRADCGACERTKRYDQLCTCTAAEVWVLDKNCDFERSAKESRALTKKEIGVAFEGKKDIIRGRSPRAKIL